VVVLENAPSVHTHFGAEAVPKLAHTRDYFKDYQVSSTQGCRAHGEASFYSTHLFLGGHGALQHLSHPAEKLS